jgi:hypothetical protein
MSEIQSGVFERQSILRKLQLGEFNSWLAERSRSGFAATIKSSNCVHKN